MKKISVLLLLLIMISLTYAGSDFTNLVEAKGGYQDRLIGGEALSELTYRLNSRFSISGELWTYQSLIGWQSWRTKVRTDIKMYRFLGTELILIGGVQGDIVDPSKRNLSPSLRQKGITKSISRYKPIYGLGFRLDSLMFFCNQCKYFFSGESRVEDFYEYNYAFNTAETAGETLSTKFVLSGETYTPFGDLEIYYQTRLRNWFDDEYMKVNYYSPYCCQEKVFRFNLGWETGFWGSCGMGVRMKSIFNTCPLPLEFQFDVKFPKEYSLWQWGISLEIPAERCQEPSNQSKPPGTPATNTQY